MIFSRHKVNRRLDLGMLLFSNLHLSLSFSPLYFIDLSIRGGIAAPLPLSQLCHSNIWLSCKDPGLRIGHGRCTKGAIQMIICVLCLLVVWGGSLDSWENLQAVKRRNLIHHTHLMERLTKVEKMPCSTPPPFPSLLDFWANSFFPL
jgi:hypothetical protein